MAGTKLTPEKITSPFQLMAAWFSMLVLLVSILLTAAASIDRPEWAAGYLVIFASILVVIVLGCVTLMLTLFRPHLQEGKEYAQWLKDRNVYSTGATIPDIASSPPKRKVRRAHGSLTNNVTTAISGAKDFLIWVASAPGCENVTRALAEAGFSAEIFNSSRHRVKTLDASAAIWIGQNIQPAGAIQAIKTAVKLWPQLQYLELSGDNSDPPEEVHRQIFIGGATSTALDRQLVKWTSTELLSLNEGMTIAEFHEAIRAKYSNL